MKIKKLLFATHFNDLRFDALKSLLELKKADLNHVVLLNVIERKKVAMRRGTGYQKKTELRLREKANIRFIDWAETLFERGMEVGVHIVVGDFTGQIIKTSVMEEIDLIVVGFEKKTKMQELFFKLNFTEIFKRVNKPILVHKSSLNKEFSFKNPFEKPLLVIDSKFKNSEIFSNIITNLNKVVRSLDVIYVAKEKRLDSSSAMKIQKTRKDARQSLNLLCERIEKGGTKTKAHVYIGDAISEIEKAAKECESSMIIMGFLLEKFWANPWEISVGSKIAERTVFPTLLIPL